MDAQIKTPGLPSYVAWKHGADVNGTHAQGRIECAYADLVAVFGEPDDQGDAYKIDAQWCLTFTAFSQYDEPATIYNYKTGKNYLKDDGLPTDQITDWHIGGKHGEVVGYIASMLIAHYRARLSE